MRLLALTLLASLIPAAVQTGRNASDLPVTVPFTLDQNRVVIDVSLPLPDGSSTRVKVWVDNGSPDLYLSRRIATQLSLKMTCNDNDSNKNATCSSLPPHAISIGGIQIPLTDVAAASVPHNPANASLLFPGMNADLNLPSTILRHYDVLIDYPNHEITLAPPGTLHFQGASTKVHIDPAAGLIQIPAQLDNKKYNFTLDIGSTISLLSAELFAKLAAAHPNWPHMTGAIGPANAWGSSNEPQSKLIKLDRLQFGSLHLIDVPVAEFPTSSNEASFQQRSTTAAGLIGASALQNYRVGLDYAHSLVYLDIGKTFNFPAFDVIGLTLRPPLGPEDKGQFTIIGVADFQGQPSVPDIHPGDLLTAVDDIPVAHATLGQVWSMLQGSPGKQRTITLERSGKSFTVAAPIRHFLAD